ncbi:unnamed protein product [Arctia plantaginis]|uniref:Uncharacterized protein n=1 Tax=Arctia plantaginis TaxID=874455 RepID=A0A8S1ANA9_ARCPL|nr:unnamed protein product [Arctia plantaginis]
METSKTPLPDRKLDSPADLLIFSTYSIGVRVVTGVSTMLQQILRDMWVDPEKPGRAGRDPETDTLLQNERKQVGDTAKIFLLLEYFLVETP